MMMTIFLPNLISLKRKSPLQC